MDDGLWTMDCRRAALRGPWQSTHSQNLRIYDLLSGVAGRRGTPRAGHIIRRWRGRGGSERPDLEQPCSSGKREANDSAESKNRNLMRHDGVWHDDS
eukprot:scaffold5571_cov142-Isochrysis_galbana.AAC.4